MRQNGFALLLSCLLLLGGLTQARYTLAAEDLNWTILQPGLALTEAVLEPFAQPEKPTPPAPAEPVADKADAAVPGSARIVLLRINPELYDFTLHMASEDQARSPSDLAERHGLLAAVNAGMYLPDQRTSTGYMKNATHVNNPRVAGKFGAFFVAGPKKDGLPKAALLDRDTDDWQSALSDYSLVVQNYRLTNTHGNILWPEGGAPHCVAALGQDADGCILFLFGRDPLSPAAFARSVQDLPLGLRSMMYLEGGSPAIMMVRAGSTDAKWSGSRLGTLPGGSGAAADMPLPNILGVKAAAH